MNEIREDAETESTSGTEDEWSWLDDESDAGDEGDEGDVQLTDGNSTTSKRRRHSSRPSTRRSSPRRRRRTTPTGPLCGVTRPCPVVQGS